MKGFFTKAINNGCEKVVVSLMVTSFTMPLFMFIDD